MDRVMLGAAILKTAVLLYFAIYILPPINLFLTSLSAIPGNITQAEVQNLFEKLSPILGRQFSVVHAVANSLIYLVLPAALWVISSNLVNGGFQRLSKTVEGGASKALMLLSRAVSVLVIVVFVYYYGKGVLDLATIGVAQFISDIIGFKTYFLAALVASGIFDTVSYAYLAVKSGRLVKHYGKGGIIGCAALTAVKTAILLTPSWYFLPSGSTVTEVVKLVAAQISSLFTYISLFAYIAVLSSISAAVAAAGIITDPVLIHLMKSGKLEGK